MYTVRSSSLLSFIKLVCFGLKCIATSSYLTKHHSLPFTLSSHKKDVCERLAPHNRAKNNDYLSVLRLLLLLLLTDKQSCISLYMFVKIEDYKVVKRIAWISLDYSVIVAIIFAAFIFVLECAHSKNMPFQVSWQWAYWVVPLMPQVGERDAEAWLTCNY